jgi:hypothetical protein
MDTLPAPPASAASAPPAPSTPTPPTKRAKKWPWIVGAGIVVLGVLAFVAVGGGSGGGHTIRGTVLLSDTAFGEYETLSVNVDSDGTCYGTGGYADMERGATVTVRDGAGNIIASSRLGPGKGEATDIVASCEFKFYLDDVPDADFYGVEVAHRGEVTYSRQELQRQDWKVDLSLGE